MNYVGREPAPSGVILVGDTNPVGMVAWFHNVPDGSWLRLNGQAVAKATYPDLWAYAQGFLTADQAANPGLYRNVDANTFAVPKLDGLFIRAQGQYDADRVSAALGVFQGDQFQSHQHPAPLADAAGAVFRIDARQEGTTSGVTTGDPITGNGGAVRTGRESRGPNVALVPCVKALRTVLMPASALPVPAVSLISEQVIANGQANVDFPNLVGYAAYRFVFSNVAPTTNLAGLYLRVSYDNLATVDGTNNYLASSSGLGHNSGAYSYSSGASPINAGYIATQVQNIAHNGVNGEMILNDSSPARAAAFVAKLQFYGQQGSTHASGAILLGAPNAVNGVRIAFDAGNFLGGRIRCYGMRGA